MIKKTANSLLFALFIFGLLSARTVLAEIATVNETTSLFEFPSTASKQIEILPVNAQVTTEGETIEAENLYWIAATFQEQHGYIRTRSLDIAQKTVKPNHRLRMWVGDGLTAINSNAGYFGNRISLGGDLDFGSDRRFVLGGSLVWWGTPESTTDLGGIHRFSLLFSAGFYIVPDAFYIKGSLSSWMISSDFNTNPSGPTSLVGTGGYDLDIGYRFALSKKTDLVISLNYDFTLSTPANPYALGASTYSGAFPTFSAFSLNLTIGHDFGHEND